MANEIDMTDWDSFVPYEAVERESPKPVKQYCKSHNMDHLGSCTCCQLDNIAAILYDILTLIEKKITEPHKRVLPVSGARIAGASSLATTETLEDSVENP